MPATGAPVQLPTRFEEAQFIQRVDAFAVARRGIERARREGRSKRELAIEAIRDAQNRAELKVDDVLAELMDSDAKVLDYLK
ncbi:hypothetical protein [Streptomyces sp. DHE17-7]|uniref:hypothetical protein n=1 Tax=Streptomyces sp. DHE17-7 TaxID=2759949 RepID=UPI0022EADDE2|nr:hypothetical protein [Streptomyces sp. DHE17-7]